MKLKATGLFLVPVAALVVACHPAAAPPSSHLAPTPPPVTTHAMTTHAVSAKPKPPAVPLPVATTTSSGSQCNFRYDKGNPLPDPKCTPGAVLTTSVASVCTPGWATAHREYFTKAEREVAFARYGVITVNPAGYGEYDHLIPLELGGSNSLSNLWPEQGKIPNPKDAVEDALHEAVCSGHANLVAAQQAIAADWTTAEKVISN